MIEVSTKSKKPAKTYGKDTNFCYVCTVTLTSPIWPWVKVMTQPWVLENNCVNYHQNQRCQSKVIAQIWIMAKHDLGSRSRDTVGSLTTSVWKIIQIIHGSKELWPRYIFWLCMHSDLDLRDRLRDNIMKHPRVSRTRIVRNIFLIQHDNEELWPRHRFGHVGTVTLNLPIWTWVKVKRHTWSFGGNKMWKDRQTYRQSNFYISRPTLWGYNYCTGQINKYVRARGVKSRMCTSVSPAWS